MRGETMKDKSKKSTYSTTFGVDPIKLTNKHTAISSPSCGAELRLQFNCTFGVLGLLLNPNNQLVANRGVVS